MRRKLRSEIQNTTALPVAPVILTVCIDRYDKLAFRYVSYAAIPLLAGYTVYSLIYESHRGWYSFIISTLTSFVYMFGFVSPLWFPMLSTPKLFYKAQLVPQLIINYKLKVWGLLPFTCIISKNLMYAYYFYPRVWHTCPWRQWCTRHSRQLWTISLRALCFGFRRWVAFMRSKQFLHQDALPASLGLFSVQWSIRLIHDCATNDFRKCAAWLQRRRRVSHFPVSGASPSWQPIAESADRSLSAMDLPHWPWLRKWMLLIRLLRVEQ